MAVAFGSVSTLFEAFNQTTNTKSFTLTAGRELVVGVVYNLNVNITAATWNTSENLVAVNGSPVVQGGLRLRMYALKNGTSGTHDVVITFDGDPNICQMLVADYSGVDTTTDFDSGTVATAGANSTNPAVTVGSVTADDMVIAFFAAATGSMAGMSAGSGTIRRQADGASGFGMALMDRASSGSVLVDGTFGANDNWAGVGADFNQAAAAGGHGALLGHTLNQLVIA